jgi:hypothetical protein
MIVLVSQNDSITFLKLIDFDSQIDSVTFIKLIDYCSQINKVLIALDIRRRGVRIETDSDCTIQTVLACVWSRRCCGSAGPSPIYPSSEVGIDGTREASSLRSHPSAPSWSGVTPWE